MGALDDLIHDGTLYSCPFMLGQGCRWGEGSRCEGCESNPDTFISDPETLRQFKVTPWAPYCLTCGEFDSAVNHPGHLIAVGFEDFKEKVPRMIMDRLTGKEVDDEETEPST